MPIYWVKEVVGRTSRFDEKDGVDKVKARLSMVEEIVGVLALQLGGRKKEANIEVEQPLEQTVHYMPEFNITVKLAEVPATV